MDPADILRAFYRQEWVTPFRPIPAAFSQHRDLFGVTSCSKGLGDTVMLMDLPRAAFNAHRHIQVYSNSESFGELLHLNPFLRFEPSKQYRTSGLIIDAPAFIRQYDCGPGHMLQRLRRVFGLPIDPIPKAYVKSEFGPTPRRVGLHLTPGASSIWQQAYLKQTRDLTPETAQAIDRLQSLRKDLEFITITRDTCHDVASLVAVLSTCEYFIGINSGPAHIAAALGIRSVWILAYPDPQLVRVPVLRCVSTHDEEFFYPQNVHLHQQGDDPLCPRATVQNLNKALNGEIYPFWDSKLVTELQQVDISAPPI